MKTCSKCGEVKPLNEYYRNKRGRDGREARCKPCRLAQVSAYNARPEVLAHRAEYWAEYYSRNRDALLAYHAEYRAQNRDALQAYHAEYRAQNRDALLAYQAEYRARPEVKVRKAEHYAANPHRNWEYQYRRRAKQYGHPVVIESFTKDELIAKYGDKCAHCGGPFEELDHYPLAVIHGGTHTIENCRPSCLTCNRPGANVRRTNTTTEKSS